jgi:hypothetical protein
VVAVSLAALVGVQLAEAGTEITLDAAVVEFVPILCVDGVAIAFCHKVSSRFDYSTNS